MSSTDAPVPNTEKPVQSEVTTVETSPLIEKTEETKQEIDTKVEESTPLVKQTEETKQEIDTKVEESTPLVEQNAVITKATEDAERVKQLGREELAKIDNDVKDIAVEAEKKVDDAMEDVKEDAKEAHEDAMDEVENIKEDIKEGIEEHSRLIAIGLYLCGCISMLWKKKENAERESEKVEEVVADEPSKSSKASTNHTV